MADEDIIIAEEVMSAEDGMAEEVIMDGMAEDVIIAEEVSTAAEEVIIAEDCIADAVITPSELIAAVGA